MHPISLSGLDQNVKDPEYPTLCHDNLSPDPVVGTPPSPKSSLSPVPCLCDVCAYRLPTCCHLVLLTTKHLRRKVHFPEGVREDPSLFWSWSAGLLGVPLQEGGQQVVTFFFPQSCSCWRKGRQQQDLKWCWPMPQPSGLWCMLEDSQGSAAPCAHSRPSSLCWGKESRLGDRSQLWLYMPLSLLWVM